MAWNTGMMLPPGGVDAHWSQQLAQALGQNMRPMFQGAQQPAVEQSGFQKFRDYMMDPKRQEAMGAIQNGLLGIGTAFRPEDPSIQILPHPYAGGPVRPNEDPGQLGLMQLMMQIARRGGGGR